MPGGTLVELARDYRVVPETPAAAAALPAEMPVAAAVLSEEMPVEVAEVWRVAAEVSVAGQALLVLARVPPIT